MDEEEKKVGDASEPEDGEVQSQTITRRQFLIGAGTGLVVGAAGAAGVIAVTTQAKPAEVGKVPETKPPQVASATGDGLLRIKPLKITINGQPYAVDVDVRWTLKDLLREHLHLTGTKTGCNDGTCGFCTVLVNDRNIYSCSVLAASLDGANIVTIEGLAKGDKLHPVQQAYWDNMGFQCGICTPGFIMSSVALLKRNPNPTLEEVREGIAGNLCRCGSYPKVFASVMDAAKKMKGA